MTPNLHPWRLKKKFSVENQIKKECRVRGLPEPVGLIRGQGPLLRLFKSRAGNVNPFIVYRFRGKRDLTQPDTQGSCWRLTFNSLTLASVTAR